MPMRAAVIHSPEYRCDIGPHVFPMDKFDRVLETLIGAGVITGADVSAPIAASREDLLLAHTAEYLDDLEHLRWTPRTLPSELPLHDDIVRAYVLAAGGTTVAARGALDCGFGVNLGGGFHHAFADHAEGFCYLNDLAVAIRVLQRDHGIERAVVVDLDVHQGNGTAAIFEADSGVFTLSMHQEQNYPSPKQRSSLDIGLPNGIDDAAYLELERRALENVWEFSPQIVLYQAGADPYREDLLGGLALTLEGLEQRDRLVLDGCAERGIPAVVTLGGGYARDRADTVRIHAATCRIALERAANASTGGNR